MYAFQTDGIQYDQYEVGIPFSRVHTCYAALADAKLYGREQRWRGFRAPALLRFVKTEPGLLSPTNGGPRAYINVEDYVKYLTFEAVNQQDFQDAWALLRSDVCQGRMHWGKSGWPASGFRGAAEYPATWCDFGCARRARRRTMATRRRPVAAAAAAAPSGGAACRGEYAGAARRAVPLLLRPAAAAWTAPGLRAPDAKQAWRGTGTAALDRTTGAPRFATASPRGARQLAPSRAPSRASATAAVAPATQPHARSATRRNGCWPYKSQ